MKDTILEKDTFCVTVGDDHNFSCTVVTIGRTGENAVSQLEITIPDELSKFWAYLDFRKPSGKTLKTPRLNVINNKLEYDIPQGLLDESGNIEAQLVLQSENGEIWKSTIKKFVVLKSIDAGDDIPEPENFITEAQKILDETVETTEKFIAEVNAKLPEKREVDPVFANNSWELIKWVAQNDDPSKYWKVGDYKMVDFPFVLSISDPRFIIANQGYLEMYLDSKSGIYKLIVSQEKQPVEVEIFYMKLTIKNSAGEVIHSEYHVTENEPYNSGVYDCGLKFDNWYAEDLETTLIYQHAQKYPLQIIGFNHDKVTDPYNYGKQRAGLTLQLGASRNFYGDTKPIVYEGVIDGLMEADGIHFKVPNRVLSDFTEGATNWADGGFRIALQNLFNGTEIAPYLTEVKKQTSHHYQEAQRWSALMDTADKVFLPSEWEYYGEVLYAPAREGDQYEFYKEGYSKFMWSSELLSGAVTNGRLHFRSTVGSKVGASLDSKYNCGVYLTVKSLDPVSVSYSYSYASGGGFIAPCICL